MIIDSIITIITNTALVVNTFTNTFMEQYLNS